MYSSKLVDVFYSLSKSQLRALRKFVRSPYHNKREDVIALFELLYKTPLTNRTALRKENAFSKIFGKKNYSADQMDYVMSFLFKVIEQFLVYENSVEDKIRVQVALMNEYRKLGLPKHFQQSLNSARKEQEKNPLRDINYHENAFAIESEYYLFLALQQRNTSNNLEALDTKMNFYFLSQKLKNACLLLAHQAVYKQQYDFSLLNVLLSYIESTPELLKQPSIGIYYYYYKAITDENLSDSFFQKFKTIFLESTFLFDKKEVTDLYVFAVNYCIKKSNIGKNEYRLELFDFYDAGLKLKILLDENQKLSPFTFYNITKVALRLGKIDWTKEYLEKYKKYVDKEFHDSYVHNAYSTLYFAQEKYDEIKIRLQQVDYSELFLTLDVKVLLIKVYYKLDEYDVLESFINSFKVFLRRKEILAYHQEIYKNFIRMIQKLINLPPFNRAAKTKLRTEIEGIDKLLEKKWLLKQLE